MLPYYVYETGMIFIPIFIDEVICVLYSTQLNILALLLVAQLSFHL